MKGILDLLKKDKKILVMGIIIVIILILMLVLPKITGGNSETPIGSGITNTKMTQQQYLDIKSSSKLLFPKTNESFRYNVYDNYIEITECLSKEKSITVPSTLENLPVLSIREGAFKESAAETVSFEPGVVYVDKEAFASNTNIQTVNFSDSVLRIGSGAFEYCTNLKSVNLGNGLEVLEDNVFLECTSLQDIVFPKTLTEIGPFAFKRCSSIKSIVLYDGLNLIGENAFEDCDSLLSITIPKTLNILPIFLCFDCDLLTSVTIEEGPMGGKDFVPRTIKESAFSECPSLTSVYIPKDFGAISPTAFENSSKSVMIYGYTSSAAALFAAQNLINFSVVDMENFKTVSTMFEDIREDIHVITSKYIGDDKYISKEFADDYIKELTQYGKDLKTNNKNLSGYGLVDNQFVLAFTNGQKLEIELKIDPEYFRNVEETTNA